MMIIGSRRWRSNAQFPIFQAPAQKSFEGFQVPYVCVPWFPPVEAAGAASCWAWS